MILDKGFCSVYSVADISEPGKMPVDGLTLKYQSWYGELNFETTPYQAELQEDVQISARIRIIQNRSVGNHDVVILSNILPPPNDALQYRIVRAFHGTDDENGQPITDLSLEKVVQRYAV